MSLERQSFRITLYLGHYYSDHRLLCKVFVSKKIKTVKDLKTHVSEFFDIDDFYFATQSIFLPDNEDVRILEKDDFVIAIPNNISSFTQSQEMSSVNKTASSLKDKKTKKKEKKLKNNRNISEIIIAPPEATVNSKESCRSKRKKEKVIPEFVESVDAEESSPRKKRKKANPEFESVEENNSSQSCLNPPEIKKRREKLMKTINYFENLNNTSEIEENISHRKEKLNVSTEMGTKLNSVVENKKQKILFSSTPKGCDSPIVIPTLKLEKKVNIIKNIVIKNSIAGIKNGEEVNPNLLDKKPVEISSNLIKGTPNQISESSTNEEKKEISLNLINGKLEKISVDLINGKPEEFNSNLVKENSKEMNANVVQIEVDIQKENNDFYVAEKKCFVNAGNICVSNIIETEKTNEKNIHSMDTIINEPSSPEENEGQKSVVTIRDSVFTQKNVDQSQFTQANNNITETNFTTPPNVNPQTKPIFISDSSSSCKTPDSNPIISEESSQLSDVSSDVTLRKRKRVRKRKNRRETSLQIVMPPPIVPLFKPPVCSASPKIHIRFEDENCDDAKGSVNKIDDKTNLINTTDELYEGSMKVGPSETRDSGVAINSPSLNTLRKSDVIVFKILKMSESYTPEYSKDIIGRVEDFDPVTGDIDFNIIEGREEFEEPQGKFSLLGDDEEEAYALKSEINTKNVPLNWMNLISPKSLYP